MELPLSSFQLFTFNLKYLVGFLPEKFNYMFLLYSKEHDWVQGQVSNYYDLSLSQDLFIAVKLSTD